MEVDVDLDMSSDCDGKNHHDYPDDFDACLNCNMDGVASCSYNSSTEQLQRYHSHSKKVIKHALRQQAKRRRKNTTIASGNTNVLPRIIVKTLPPKPPEEMVDDCPKASTMKEVLASIPGFSIKPRKRSNKKLSTAAQLEQTKEGCIDLETPDSILVNTNIRALLNKHTFASLPSLYQHKLVQLLPSVDRPKQADHSSKLTTSGLNNEFFARACLEWRERLSEGEFTPENQQKLKAEAEKEKSKLDPWKLKHFEPIWGDKSQSSENIHSILVPNGPSRPALKTTIKLRPSTSICKHSKSSSTMRKQRLRTVGAVTRAITSYREENCAVEESCSSPPHSISEKTKFQTEIQRPEIVLSQIHSSDSRESDIEVEKEEVDPLQITDPLVVFEPPSDIPIADVIVTDILQPHTAEKRSRSNSPSDLSENNPKRHSPDPYPCSAVLFSMKCESPDASNLSEKEITPDKDSDVYFEQNVDFPSKDISGESNIVREDCELAQSNSDSLKDNCDSPILKIEHDFPENIPSQESTNDYSFDGSQMKNDSAGSEEADSISDLKFPEGQIEAKIIQESHGTQDIHGIHDSQDEVNDSHETHGTGSHETHDDLSDAIDDLHSGLLQGAKLPSSLILQQDTMMIAKECSEVYGEQTFEKLEASVKESDLVTFSQSVDLNADDDADDANEDRFIDAENFVLESGAISSPDLQNVEKFVQDATTASNEEVSKNCGVGEDLEADADEMQAALFAAAVARGEDCCWDVVDSSTEKLLADVPLHALDSVNVSVSMEEESNNDVKVIPMQEELEVRLEEGSFQVGSEWPYVFKMDQDMMSAALGSSDSSQDPLKMNSKNDEKSEFAEYQPTGNQVKLELEVTLTPEAVNSDSMVTSTVTSSSTTTPSLNKNTVTTVIPPTTIVCLPSVVATSTNLQLSQIPSTNMVRTALVASSSAAVPYLTLSTSQPMRPLSQHKAKTKQTSQVSSGISGANRNRSASNKPPPGAVNLERSYQICQAVIQNSPNRDQLRCQLKPPPSLLAVQNTTSNNSTKKSATQYSAVSSSRNTNKVFNAPHQIPTSVNNVTVKPPIMMSNQNKILNNARLGQRQQSPPVVVRHVFTSNQGIPVTMAVLPQSQSTDMVETQPPGSLSQYILVQRADMGDNSSTPRASSAPPQQVAQGGAALGGLATQGQVTGTACNRLRPASVDMEQRPQVMLYGSTQGPHPGTQAISKREKMYGDICMDNYAIVADNLVTPASQVALQKNMRQNLIVPRSDGTCACNLKAMIVCKNCGAFCHDDCIGPSRLCVTCLIR